MSSSELTPADISDALVALMGQAGSSPPSAQPGPFEEAAVLARFGQEMGPRLLGRCWELCIEFRDLISNRVHPAVPSGCRGQVAAALFQQLHPEISLAAVHALCSRLQSDEDGLTDVLPAAPATSAPQEPSGIAGDPVRATASFQAGRFDPDEVSRAVVLYFGWKRQFSWPQRDEAAVIEAFGPDSAPALIKLVDELQDEFYVAKPDEQWDHACQGHIAAALFLAKHPEMSYDAARAIQWVWEVDYR